MASVPRPAMYAMLAGNAFSNYITRGMLAPLVQFIVAEGALNAAEKALLLGAFFPVFTPFQVVAGPLTQLLGGKNLLSINMGGMAALLFALPSLSHSVWGMCACLAGIGVCQGVLVPAQGQLKRNWLPDGPGRVWGLRIIGLGMRVGYPAAASFVPWLAARAGWQYVPYALATPMAVFAGVWHLFASDNPVEADPPASAVSPTGSSSSALPKAKAMEWGVFRVRAILAAVCAHVASNNLLYCFTLWAPTYYNDVLKVSNVAAGAYISFPQTVGIWLPFIIGGWENRLRAKGVGLLRLRKTMTNCASVIQAASCIGFVKASTPVLACIANTGVHVGTCLHGSGFLANYLEVGGPDVALMYAIGNALASVPGMILPPLGLTLMRRFNGSWLPLFGLTAAFTLGSSFWFNLDASIRPGRDLLAEQQQRRQKLA